MRSTTIPPPTRTMAPAVPTTHKATTHKANILAVMNDVDDVNGEQKSKKNKKKQKNNKSFLFKDPRVCYAHKCMTATFEQNVYKMFMHVLQHGLYTNICNMAIHSFLYLYLTNLFCNKVVSRTTKSMI